MCLQVVGLAGMSDASINPRCSCCTPSCRASCMNAGKFIPNCKSYTVMLFTTNVKMTVAVPDERSENLNLVLHDDTQSSLYQLLFITLVYCYSGKIV